MTDLRETLVGYADWLGYGHGERAAAWLQRLEINRPELEAFRAADDGGGPPYAPRACAIVPADGQPGAPAAVRAAAEALAQARERADLHAFTWLPEALPRYEDGFLAGVPIAVKDLMLVAGAPLTGGSRALGREVATSDAPVVARLRRAGCVVMGLTNLHEVAYGITSDNPNFGRVVNPAAADRIAGGSSGGSAAAIAAGIVDAAVGTDTAGSIRIPAACCGVVGFKPSYDAVPRAGVLDLAPTLDHVGPLGRRVEYCAALFAAMLDADALPPWRYASLAGRCVATLGGYFDDPLDPEVRSAVEGAAAALAGDGARVARREVAGMELAAAIQLNTICAEATAVHAARLARRGADFGEDVRVRLEMGYFLPGAWYVKAQRMRSRLVAAIEALLREADFLLCATLRAPAPRAGASRVAIGSRDYALHTALTQLTLPFNLSGLPAVTVPWSSSSDGVPIGVQLVGRRGDDWATLAAAERLQALSPWARSGAGTRGD